ncbi:MAG: Hsp70 family protein, partial [Deltaproteobacteria bacterium]|nr:Hsp70 family protein [Deltaproteobacteria bacterium]
MTDLTVGIDLGTSNSVVAYADGAGKVQVLADDASYKIHPSVVSFHPNGGVIVGAPAKQRKVIDPANTVYSAKRLLGRRYQSPEVQTAKARLPYTIKEGGNQMPLIVTRAGEFAVPEVSAIILDHLKRIANQRLDADVRRAVITVPASFNDAQRSATATAGAVAGLTVVRVLNEPTAAALAYGHARGLRQVIAVYDFGGGTFDVTILRLHDQIYEVLGTAGDNFLGGDDLDERLVDTMVSKFLIENHIDLRTNEVSMMRLRAVAEQTKIELSRRARAVVRVDEIAYGPKGVALNLQIELAREELVSQIQPLVDRTFPVCDEALALAGIGIDAIDDVILVGGTTKIPYVRDQVTKFFNKTPRSDVAPEEVVAVGAALQAASLDEAAARKRASKSAPVQRVSADFGGDTDTTDGLATPTTVTVPRRTNPYGAE